jgi:PAS domain S-box-containing protein
MDVPLRVLIVDDSDEDAALSVHELRRAGFDVTWRRVETPQAMASALAEANWDIVLADYAMPRFTGLAALQLIQSGGYDLPFIVVSGTFGEEAAVAAMRAGARDYVLKDHLHRLVGIVEREVREAEVRHERWRAEAALRESEAITSAIVNTAVDGIITIDERGLIQSFNPAAERLFGYSAAEVLGQNVSMLMPAPHDAEHDDYVATYLRTGVQRIIGIGREVAGQRKDGATFPMELAVSEVALGDRRLFTGIVRDISERKRADMRLALQFATTRVLAASPSLSEAGPRLLQAICEAIGWQVGELWRVDAATNTLRWSTCWNPASLDASAFIALSQGTAFGPGEGLPGHVWANGQPAWIRDVRAASCMNRIAAAANLGLHGAFGFPVRTDTTVLGVMVFFGHQHREPSSDWLETLDALGRQIGDFIERKRAEEAIRDSEARFRSLITRSPDTIIVVDDHGIVRFVNPAAEMLLDRGASALVGEPFGFPIVAGDATEVDILRRGRPAAIAEMRVVRTEWQGERVSLASLHNITRRRHMESALHESEHRFAQFMYHLPGVAFMKDVDGRYLYVNDAFEELFHRKLGEYVGKTDDEVWPPQIAAQLRTNDRQVVETRSVLQTTEAIPHDDGMHHWLVTKFPILNGDGEPTMVGGVAIDVTERRRAEAELRELQKITQQRERLADIGAITAQIVHDLGNPLAGVSMQAQLILRRASRDASQPVSTVVKPVESILAEVRRLDSLTKEFMEFSREQRLALKAVDLCRFLQRIVDLWQPVAAARAISISFDSPPDVPPLTADEEKLHRVFDNLVKNAIEAIEQGPGRVGIEVTRARTDAVRISVTDTGPGIPETVQVFRLFETTKPEGSGVGLAVARQIVLAHRGSIECARLTPRGTVFNVDLPCGGRTA